jgi:transcriptional regulator
MRHTPRYLMTDPDEVKRLVRAHPWATLVSATSGGLVASHYPVLLDEQSADITLLSHVGRPDDDLHELGRNEILVIVQGPHDYVSPSWYEPGDVVPTWNHVTAHLYGTPVILDEEENYAVLCRLTHHFEQHHPHGRSLAEDEAGTRRIAKGTVGLRLRVDRFEARAKLSQNKSAEVRERITEHLSRDNPALAEEMRRVPQLRPAAPPRTSAGRPPRR